MPNFVWSVRDAGGNQMIREVQAQTSEESRRILLAEGCTDLILKEDEISDVAVAGMGKAEFLGEQIDVTAKERLKHRNKKPATFLSVFAEGMWGAKWVLAVFIFLGGLSWYRGSKTGALAAAAAVAAWAIFVTFVGLPMVYYRRLHKASDWNRWDEVMSLVNALERIGRYHFIKIPPPELGRYRAKVVAAQGHLDAALREYQQYENQPGCPGWLYKAHVAALHDLVGQHDEAIEWTLKSLAEKASPVIYLDLANRYARHIKDPVKAREALTEAEKSPLPDTTIPSQHRYRGEVAYVEGNHEVAKQELETAIRLMEATPHVPFRDGNIAIGRAYLCLVLAKLGDLSGAEKNFRAALPYLRATDEAELIADCESALQRKQPVPVA